MKKSIADWRIFEFLKESNGQFSSTRLFAFSIIASAIIDWQRAIWMGDGIWHPEYATIGLVAGVLGVKVLQKRVEKDGNKTSEFLDQGTGVEETGGTASN